MTGDAGGPAILASVGCWPAPVASRTLALRPTVLHLHQGNRLERLADRLTLLLREAPAAPFVAETVVVQSRGMERWLRLRLAGELGICAHMRFPLPAAFAWELLRAAGPSELPEAPPPPLAWRMLGAFEGSAEEEAPWRELPRGGEARALLALQLDEVFSKYLVYRPDWLLEWEREAGAAASPETRFQAALWRCLAAGGAGGLHWARRSKELLERAAAGTLTTPAWPHRVSLFALPELSPRYLQLLNVLARFCELHLFVLNPCQEYWGDIVTREVRERASAPYMEEGNRLLAVLGRQGRDLQELLLEHCPDADSEELFESPAGDGILPRLQREFLQLRDPGPRPRSTGGAPETPVLPPDPSLEVHSCHSPLREVEALHDRLLSLFDDDPGLRPGQVAVTAPEFSAYTGCLDAVFGAAPPERRIPYVLGADRGVGLRELFLRLLRLPRERVDSHYVLDLLEEQMLRRRFDLDEEDLGRVRGWLPDAGVAWGLDESDWRDRDLPPAPAHTWRTALDRLSLGYALPLAGELFMGLAPVPVLDWDGLKTLNGLGALLETLRELRKRLGKPRTPERWAELLRELIGRCLQPEAGREAELTPLRSAVRRFEKAAADADYRGKLELEAMVLLLNEQFSTFSAPSSRDGVLCAPMAVLRRLPFEVVCVLGLNDGSLPRPRRRFHFDLLREAPRRRGDRSPRDEDRALFLDAILAARRCLYLSYTGRRGRDDAPLPPARPLQELLDYLGRGRDRAKFPVIQHPLHPFSHRCFDPDTSALQSYASEFCPDPNRDETLPSAPEAFFPAAEPVSGAPPQAPAGSPSPWPGQSLDLGELIEFFQDPARHLLRGRFSLWPPRPEESLPRTEFFQLDGLRRYQLRTRLLKELLAGSEPEPLRRLLHVTGLLPPGAVGTALLCDELAAVQGLVTAIREVPRPEEKIQEREFTLDGWRLRCRLSRLGGVGVLHYRAGRLRPKDEIALWLEHLAWSLGGDRGDSLALGLDEEGGVERRRLRHLDDGCAARELRSLLKLYEVGRERPLPCPPGSARKLALALSKERTRQNEDPPMPRDSIETEQWFFRTAFRGYGWRREGQEERETDFESCARAVWEPLLAHLEKT